MGFHILLEKYFSMLSSYLCRSYTKKNCEGNPWCLYGFGEKKEGVWKNPDVILDVLCENITKTRSVAQPCGLHNAGATCYLSVILQVERIIKIDEYSLLPPFYVDYLS